MELISFSFSCCCCFSSSSPSFSASSSCSSSRSCSSFSSCCCCCSAFSSAPSFSIYFLIIRSPNVHLALQNKIHGLCVGVTNCPRRRLHALPFKLLVSRRQRSMNHSAGVLYNPYTPAFSNEQSENKKLKASSRYCWKI